MELGSMLTGHDGVKTEGRARALSAVQTTQTWPLYVIHYLTTKGREVLHPYKTQHYIVLFSRYELKFGGQSQNTSNLF